MIRAAASLAIVAIAAGIVTVLLTLASAIDRLPDIAQAEAAATREMLRGEIASLREDARQQIAGLRVDLGHRADRVEALVDRHALRIEDSALVEISRTRGELLSEVRPVLRGSASLLATYEAIPAAVGSRLDPWTDCRGNGACWQAQTTATLGAARYTLGAVARSAPQIATSIEKSAEASERATEATAAAMRNLQELSRPLPRWLRVPLQILGPTAPLYLPFVTR